jgi:phosphoribosylformimino-5-aminoimidazole carboxamide ribotide isomerase
LLSRLEQRFPSLTLWVDAGFSTHSQIETWSTATRAVPVIGSESVAQLENLGAMLAAAPNPVLSLDTRGDQTLGPADLFTSPHLWPQRVIVMTLERVGTAQGPALAELRQTLELAGEKKIIAAGGVRNGHDLEKLEAMGVYAVLIATAIHDGTLEPTELSRYLS